MYICMYTSHWDGSLELLYVYGYSASGARLVSILLFSPKLPCLLSFYVYTLEVCVLWDVMVALLGKKIDDLVEKEKERDG